VANLDDERGTVFANDRWGRQRTTITRPRTFGISFRKSFE
jgi:hypothetical protein